MGSMNYKTQGIVIRRHDFSEADRILTVFTERFGKIKVIAKGVKKIKAKLAGSLEPFMLSDLELHEGKTFYIATGASIIKDFSSLHSDLDKMAAVFCLGELIDKFEKEEQKSEQVFRLLVDTLEALDAPHYSSSDVLSKSQISNPSAGSGQVLKSRNDISKLKSYSSSPDVSGRSKNAGSSRLCSNNTILRAFEIRLLHLSGYLGDLMECLHCKAKITPGNNNWDGEEGGIICADCQSRFHHGRAIADNLIKFFRLAENGDFTIISRLNLSEELCTEAEVFLSGYICSVLESDLRSNRFLKNLH